MTSDCKFLFQFIRIDDLDSFGLGKLLWTTLPLLIRMVPVANQQEVDWLPNILSNDTFAP
jgi:hypothetical protein